MKKLFIQVAMRLMAFLFLAFLYSCETESQAEEELEFVKEDQLLEISDIDTDEDEDEDDLDNNRAPWQGIFWDTFNTLNQNRWEITERADYNSARCEYKADQVDTGTWEGVSFLRLTAQNINSTKWKSGHVKSKRKFKPGINEEIRFRARIKFDAFNPGYDWKPFSSTYGCWPAFWTVNESVWPTNGEIDIMEGYTYGNRNNDRYASNIIYGTSEGANILNGSQTTNHYSNSVNGEGGWTTYEMRWSNRNGWNRVQIYVNGVKKKTYSNHNIDNLRLDNFSSHNIILNLNVGSDNGIFDNSRINVFERTTMLVDWVSVDKRSI